MKRRAIIAAITASFAWILWAEHHAAWNIEPVLIPKSWRIIDAFETKKGCDAEQLTHMEDLIGQRWTAQGRTTAVMEIQNWVITYRYLCLPGMFDPRPIK